MGCLAIIAIALVIVITGVSLSKVLTVAGTIFLILLGVAAIGVVLFSGLTLLGMLSPRKRKRIK